MTSTSAEADPARPPESGDIVPLVAGRACICLLPREIAEARERRRAGAVAAAAQF